ncbi:MAG: aldolase [Mycobacterium sp.]|nr:aldolase [Mycobacterium sp.]
MTRDFVHRLRAREQQIGYWVVSDNAAATERIASAGYDYVCLDTQHGLLDYQAALAGVMAVELGGSAAVVRVPADDAAWIGKALDAGARAVIVPLIESEESAKHAARACRYPPVGIRSYGPTRAALRMEASPQDANDQIACILMIETLDGLNNAADISATPGVDALYIGPSDLSISLGGSTPQDGWRLPTYHEALATIRTAAHKAGKPCGLHVTNGPDAARALNDGFDFVSISNDLNHILSFARDELAQARTAVAD